MPVYREAPGKWRIRVWIKGQKFDRVETCSKREAADIEAAWKLELRQLDPAVARATLTISGLSLLYLEAAKHELRRSTLKRNVYHLAELGRHFGDVRLMDLGVAHVDAYKAKRRGAGVRAVTINNELRILRRLVSWAKQRGYHVPEVRWRQLKERDSTPVIGWTAAEVARLLDACVQTAPRLMPIVMFLANTGCRKGEALALTWEHVDLARDVIRIWPSEAWQPKSGKPREVPLEPVLKPWLQRAGSKCPFVFPNEDGKRWAVWPQRAFDRAVRLAGLKGGPHKLRHTFVSYALANKRSLREVGEIIGHSDEAMTRRYSHLVPDALDRMRGAVSFAAPVGPAALAATEKWGRDRPVHRPARSNKTNTSKGEVCESTMERATGVEPATPSLGSSKRSTKRR